MAQLFTDQSISAYQTADGKPIGVCKQGFSLSVQVMGKSRPHIVRSNYLYLFVWATLCILFILYFKLPFCNGPETELKCNKGFRETIHNWRFIIHGQLALSPFQQ